MIAISTLQNVAISPFLMSLLISTILPPVVGFITKLTTHPAVKATLLLLLNAVTTLLTGAALVGEHYVITKQSIITTLVAFVVSTGAYSNFWKKLGITSSMYTPPVVTNTPVALTPDVVPVPVLHQPLPIPGKLALVGVK